MVEEDQLSGLVDGVVYKEKQRGMWWLDLGEKGGRDRTGI